MMITCPNCGRITNEEVQVYNESLRQQSFSISPVLPVCKLCGAEVEIVHQCSGGHVIVLNGTSGSGKSTVAEALIEKGFLAIDGDCAIQVLRHKTGNKKYDWNELTEEIAHEIDILSVFGKNIVLSHIVLPEDLDKYIDIFKKRKLKYRFFLLKPQYQTAVERCRTRTCHTSVTPEYWLKHFYDLLVFDSRVVTVDNTNMTVEETAEHILLEVL